MEGQSLYASALMDAAQKQHLIDVHRDSLALYGSTTDALHWASRGQQKLRFRVLADIGVTSGDSLLDVGCGFADLRDWLSSHDMDVDYTGLDLSTGFVAIAAQRHADATLLCGELFDADFALKSFDWVVLSGTLNWQLNDDGAYARRLIARMFEICRFGGAFNMLDARHRGMR
ncbi:MAG: methyltransferase domain-containing protein, partial [Mariprofundaceae bacterium]|nr:methyltransferase domain-containing protein [Mariprofundaceae bacterium]